MFAGCRIELSKKVLIPRPETEFWTRAAIIDLVRAGSRPAVLDIFSGSGCIGIAVAKSVSGARVDFGDIDENALAQIRINLNINAIEADRVRVYSSDIFNGIPNENAYDAILANPPYVDPGRINQVQGSVLDHEPHRALFSGNRGLDAIESFLRTARAHLNDKGLIYLEFDPAQRQDIIKMCARFGYSKTLASKDQYGRWRFARICK